MRRGDIKAGECFHHTGCPSSVFRAQSPDPMCSLLWSNTNRTWSRGADGDFWRSSNPDAQVTLVPDPSTPRPSKLFDVVTILDVIHSRDLRPGDCFSVPQSGTPSQAITVRTAPHFIYKVLRDGRCTCLDVDNESWEGDMAYSAVAQFVRVGNPFQVSASDVKEIPKYPHKCRCGAPAYFSLFTGDCSGNCAHPVMA